MMRLLLAIPAVMAMPLSAGEKERVFERYYTGESIQDGHNRYVFLTQFTYDWSFPALEHLKRIQPEKNGAYWAGDEMTIVDVMLVQFFRVLPYANLDTAYPSFVQGVENTRAALIEAGAPYTFN